MTNVVCQVRAEEGVGVITGGTADDQRVSGTDGRGCWCDHRWDC